MKALTISEYGSADVLELRELHEPIPAAEDVLVQVKVASINPVDWKIRRGDLSIVMPRRFPRVLGIDLAGVVVRVGSAVRAFAPGDKVFGMADPLRNQYGSYAEFSLVEDTKLAPMPQGLSFEDAAAIPVAGLTAYKALFEIGHMKSGQNVLINGGGGGVGSFAVQLAKIGGARVTATCGPGNMEFVHSLGADVVLNYKVSDVRKSEDKFSIIFDASAKLDFFGSKDILTDNGVFVGTNPTPELVLACGLTAPFAGKKAAIVLASSGKKISQQLSELGNLVCKGKLHPVIDRIVPLREVAAAQRTGEAEHTRGKVLVQVG